MAGKKKATLKHRARRAGAVAPISGEFSTPVHVRIGGRGLSGYLTKGAALQVVDALREIGLEVDEPSLRDVVQEAESTTKAHTTTRRMTNRVRILTETNVDLQALEQAAVAKGMEFRRLLLHDAVTIDEAKDALGVGSPQTLHNWLKQKRLLGLPDRHRTMIPKWQFDPETRDGIVAGLDRVLQVLNGNPFGIAYWLITKNSHLDNRSPIELLRRGRVGAVVEEAQGVGLAQ